GDLPRLPTAALAPARSAARVRVPRRRAQDDLLLRGGAGAHARQLLALLAAAPPLRHELPARGDDRRDLRLRPDRAAGLVLAAADPRSRRPGGRRRVVRAPAGRPARPPRWVAG